VFQKELYNGIPNIGYRVASDKKRFTPAVNIWNTTSKASF
jgi:hypothetical protein